MNDPFYATIKLTTGEEILPKYVPPRRMERSSFSSDPVVIEENNSVDIESGISKYAG